MSGYADIALRQTVLIVDDTPDIVRLVATLLKAFYQPRVAIDGGRAPQAAASPQPDLILLDVEMPSMDGYEVCDRLKSDPQTVEIPVVVLTARCRVEEEERGLRLSAVDCIGKSISPPILLVRFQAHRALRHARRFLERIQLSNKSSPPSWWGIFSFLALIFCCSGI